MTTRVFTQTTAEPCNGILPRLLKIFMLTYMGMFVKHYMQK